MPRSQQIMLRSMKQYAESKINLAEGAEGSFKSSLYSSVQCFSALIDSEQPNLLENVRLKKSKDKTWHKNIWQYYRE